MPITFYDLSGKEGRRFSPFGWRARMALAHKGLEKDSVVELIRFSDKEKLAFSGQKLVPVIVDGDRVVNDSFTIALYLDEAYPDAPSLFGGDAGVGMARIIEGWAGAQVFPILAGMIVGDIPKEIEEVDKAYFRESREKRFGKTLEEVIAGREERLDGFAKALTPARKAIEDRPFIGGETANYADYILFGLFMWARGVSDFKLLAEDDPLHGWRERLLDSFDGMPRTEPGYPV